MHAERENWEKGYVIQCYFERLTTNTLYTCRNVTVEFVLLSNLLYLGPLDVLRQLSIVAQKYCTGLQNIILY